MAIPFWKLRLQPASFKGATFHVEAESRISGRRIALKEFPKKDLPYPEDMARRARRFRILGYLIGPDYTFLRDDLVRQLESEGPGQLLLPTELNQDVLSVVVEHFSSTERRERGGYAEVEMAFIEVGSSDFIGGSDDSRSQVTTAAQTLVTNVLQAFGGLVL